MRKDLSVFFQNSLKKLFWIRRISFGAGVTVTLLLTLPSFAGLRSEYKRNLQIEIGANNCALAIRARSLDLDKDSPSESFLTSNEIVITGGSFHTLDDILGNLHLDRHLEGFRGKSVLSVGEGYSELLPFLLSKGISAYAADSAYPEKNQSLGQYISGFPTLPSATQFKSQSGPILENLSRDQKQNLLQFVKNYRDHLIHVSTTQLPLPDGTFDFVLSHRLLNNVVSAEEVLDFLREWIRVARFQVRVEGISPPMINEISRVLHREYGDQVEIQFFADHKLQTLGGEQIRSYIVTLILTRH